MQLTTRLKRGHVLRQLIIGIVCVVLGVWGVYDYVYTIPMQQQAHERYVVASAVQAALESKPADDDFDDNREAALQEIRSSANKLLETRLNEQIEGSGKSASDLQSLSEEDRQIELSKEDEMWLAFLMQSEAAVRSPRPMTGKETLTEQQTIAFENAQTLVNENAEVSKPERYDRIMKGLVFIPCLPIGAYMVLMLGLQSRKRYTLNEQGDLKLANGQLWKRDEIADIDMDKWMRKSVALVKHTDGIREAKLDDYIHQDMHLIVGALAHRFYPDQWTEDARPVKSEEDEQAAWRVQPDRAEISGAERRYSKTCPRGL